MLKYPRLRRNDSCCPLAQNAKFLSMYTHPEFYWTIQIHYRRLEKLHKTCIQKTPKESVCIGWQTESVMVWYFLVREISPQVGSNCLACKADRGAGQRKPAQRPGIFRSSWQATYENCYQMDYSRHFMILPSCKLNAKYVTFWNMIIRRLKDQYDSLSC